jgi:hypothetical protein
LSGTRAETAALLELTASHILRYAAQRLPTCMRTLNHPRTSSCAVQAASSRGQLALLQSSHQVWNPTSACRRCTVSAFSGLGKLQQQATS